VLEVVADEFLDVADRELLGRRSEREGALSLGLRQGQEGAAVARLDLALGEELLDLGGSCSSRIVFATCERETPSRSASVSCLRPSSSRSSRKASASSTGLRFSRWMFSMSASAQRLRVVALAQDDGHGGKAGELGRAEPSLPAMTS